MVEIYSKSLVVFFLFFFNTGVVQLSLAGLPLTSCSGSLGHLLCRGSPQRPFSLVPLAGFEPMQGQSKQQVPTP